MHRRRLSRARYIAVSVADIFYLLMCLPELLGYPGWTVHRVIPVLPGFVDVSSSAMLLVLYWKFMCIFFIGGKLTNMIYLFGKCVCHDALAMVLSRWRAMKPPNPNATEAESARTPRKQRRATKSSRWINEILVMCIHYDLACGFSNPNFYIFA